MQKHHCKYCGREITKGGPFTRHMQGHANDGLCIEKATKYKQGFTVRDFIPTEIGKRVKNGDLSYEEVLEKIEEEKTERKELGVDKAVKAKNAHREILDLIDFDYKLATSVDDAIVYSSVYFKVNFTLYKDRYKVKISEWDGGIFDGKFETAKGAVEFIENIVNQ